MESQYKSPNVVCSGCGNNEFLSPPLALGTVLCVKCFTNTEYKTGKKVFSSYPHPTNPYNYSEDELFLVLSFGGLVALYSADQKNHISKVYGWLKGENEDFFDGGIGLDDEKIKKLHKRLLGTNDNDPEGDDKGIVIAKKLSQDERENLFNLLFGMLMNQKDTTIEEAAALIKICEITEPNWISFAQYVSENTPFKFDDLVPLVRGIKLPLMKFKKDGEYTIIEDLNLEDFGQNDSDVNMETEEEKESEQSNVNKPKPRVLYGGDVQEEKKIKQDDNNFYVKKNYLGIPAHFPIDHNKGCSEYISKFLPFKKSNGETIGPQKILEFGQEWEDVNGKKYITNYSRLHGIYTVEQREVEYSRIEGEDIEKDYKQSFEYGWKKKFKDSDLVTDYIEDYEESSNIDPLVILFIIAGVIILLSIIS